MPRVGLINTYSTHNIGDSAIYAAYAHILHDVELVSDLAESAAAPMPGIAYGAVSGQCDAYLSVGGDIFNNAREWLITRRFLANVRALSGAPNDRTFVFGQSIPPSCRGLAFRILARTMRTLSSVHVRDETTYSKLRACGVNAKLSFDSAFGLTPGSAGAKAAQALCAQAGVVPEQSAFISLRGFTGMYGYSSHELLGRLHQLACSLSARGHQPVFVLQSRVDSSDDDLQIAAALAREVPQARVLDLTQAQGAQPWDVAAAVLAAARIVVAVRYHTSVLRMLSGRGAYNIYYSNKGADLVRRLGQPGVSLQHFEPAAAIAAIERSAEQPFDITPVRAQVTADLRQACRRALDAQNLSPKKEQRHVA